MKPISNLTKGAELLYELKGKVYPVQFVSYKGIYNNYTSINTLFLYRGHPYNIEAESKNGILYYSSSLI